MFYLWTYCDTRFLQILLWGILPGAEHIPVVAPQQQGDFASLARAKSRSGAVGSAAVEGDTHHGDINAIELAGGWQADEGRYAAIRLEIAPKAGLGLCVFIYLLNSYFLFISLAYQEIIAPYSNS